MNIIKTVFKAIGEFFSWIFHGILNLLYRNKSFQKILDELKECLANENLLDKMLEVLLNCLSLLFIVDWKFRRNIKDFNAVYSFKSMDNKISLAAAFKNSKMKVYNEALPDSTITVMFKDGKTLRDFIFSSNPDIIQGMLDNKLSYKGNLNYLLKFGYIVNHLRYSFGL